MMSVIHIIGRSPNCEVFGQHKEIVHKTGLKFGYRGGGGGSDLQFHEQLKEASSTHLAGVWVCLAHHLSLLRSGSACPSHWM